MPRKVAGRILENISSGSAYRSIGSTYEHCRTIKFVEYLLDATDQAREITDFEGQGGPGVLQQCQESCGMGEGDASRTSRRAFPKVGIGKIRDPVRKGD